MMKKIGFQKGHGFGGGAVLRHFDGIKVFFSAKKSSGGSHRCRKTFKKIHVLPCEQWIFGHHRIDFLSDSLNLSFRSCLSDRVDS